MKIINKIKQGFGFTKNQNQLYLTLKEIQAMDSNIFKTLLFFYDKILIDTPTDFLNFYFDEKKQDQETFFSPGEVGHRKDIADIMETIWSNDLAEYNPRSNLIIGKSNKLRKFEGTLVMPYYMEGMLPIVSRDIFEPIQTAHFKHFKINPTGYFDMINGKERTTINSVDLAAMKISEEISRNLLDLFEKAYFNKTLNYSTAYNSNSILMSKLIQELPNYSLKSIKNGQSLRNLFPKINSLHEILNVNSEFDPKQDYLNQKMTMQLAIQKVEDVPISEIEKFRAKDGIKSLHQFTLMQISKYKGIKPEEIIESLNNKIADTMNILRPKKGQILIDILSNIPSPIVFNPVGLFSLFSNIGTSNKLKNTAFVFEYAKFKQSFK